ncbi:rRNA maturation RNase YbeY, partial [Oceanospirillaceae bacterium]|nr:rRNA maturation RNase YbeY [Oceanospirillaceae bacterium]
MMVDLQIACDDKNLPSLAQLEQWTTLALQTPNAAAEITIRMVDNEESHALNLQYRGQDKATNVLSFPFETPEFEDPTLAAEIAHELGPVSYLGDLVVNAPLLAQEAAQQHKNVTDHWAHLIIHGTLHLQGFDHIEDQEAEEMEALEGQLLA